MPRIANGEQVLPDECYLRTALRFETVSKKYDWMNQIVGAGVGRYGQRVVFYDAFDVLQSLPSFANSEVVAFL